MVTGGGGACGRAGCESRLWPASAAGWGGGDCLRRVGVDGYFIEAGQQLEVCNMGGGRQRSGQGKAGRARRSGAGEKLSSGGSVGRLLEERHRLRACMCWWL